MAKTNPEEGAQKLTGTESFIEKYRKHIIYGGVGIVVVIISIIGYQKWVIEPEEKASQDEYWNAFYDFQNEDTTDAVLYGTETYLGMEDVASQYSGYSGGNIAAYCCAIVYMERGDFENALTYLEQCEFEDIMVGTLVVGLKGDCNVELGNFEEAAVLFEEAAAREENEFTSPLFLKKAGLVYEELGQNDKAAELYTKIDAEWPLTPEGQDIQKYLVRAQN
jgi:tetratricopeptide (TPR) repeat protein